MEHGYEKAEEFVISLLETCPNFVAEFPHPLIKLRNFPDCKARARSRARSTRVLHSREKL